MAGHFDPDEFEEAHPHMFYMHPELLEFADDSWLVAGVGLPVHASVVSVKSSVFRAAYLTQRESDHEGEGQQGVPGTPMGAGKLGAAAFDGYSIKQVSLFLRFLYQPDDATPVNLATAAPHLPALARLAHKFDVGALLAAVEAAAVQLSAAAGWVENMQALRLAEELHLERLLASSALSAASMLIEADKNPRADHAAASFFLSCELGTLEAHTVGLVLGSVVAAIGSRGDAALQRELCGLLPGQSAVVEWVGVRGACHSYVWEVASVFSGAARLVSPAFSAGGHTWQLHLYPQGDQGQPSGFMSVYVAMVGARELRPGQRVKAAAYFTLLHWDDPTQNLEHAMEVVAFSAGDDKWGEDVADAQVVRDPARGFLRKGAIKLKVDLLF